MKFSAGIVLVLLSGTIFSASLCDAERTPGYDLYGQKRQPGLEIRDRFWPYQKELYT
jgi:hypothetical protein